MNRKTTKNIGFISTRIAGTDGVSLEIEKWATVLERNKFRCFYFAGEVDRDPKRSFYSPEALFSDPQIENISKACFGSGSRPGDISALVKKIAYKLKNDIAEFVDLYDIHLLIPENALTIPMNIPLGIAITDYIAETGIPAIAHHHDFYWERERFLQNDAADYLDYAFPPTVTSIKHVTINSIALKELKTRKNISGTVIPNVYDFKNKPGQSDNTVIDVIKEESGVKGKHLILQPTRVVPRKCIDLAIDLVSRLEGAGKTLVISHKSGDEGDAYKEMIDRYALDKGVRVVYLDHCVISNNARVEADCYTLGDVYHASDFITYPSDCEGFGNAFLETIYYRKPILVNRYPVFIEDIEPKGFDCVKIDGAVTDKTVDEVNRILNDKGKFKDIVEENYRIASRYYSLEVLEKILIDLVQSFG